MTKGVNGDAWLFEQDSEKLGAVEVDFTNRLIRFSKNWAIRVNAIDRTLTFDQWSDLVPSDDRNILKSYLDPEIIGLAETVYAEHNLLLPDHDGCFLFLHGSVVARDELHAPTGLKAIVKDITNRRDAEYKLNERIKELGCLGTIDEILAKSGLTIFEALDQCVKSIPAGWQYPEITVAKIKFKELIFNSMGYQECEHRQTCVLETKSGNECLVEVGYLPGIRHFKGDPFLKEEFNLINLIGVRLVQYIDRYELLDEITLKEGQLKFIIDNLNEIVFELDDQKRIITLSPSIESVLGYKAERLIGLKASQWPDAQGNPFINFKEVKEAGRKSGQAVVKKADGSEIWVRHSSRAIFENGRFRGILGTIHDISDLKTTETELIKSRELYESILQASPDAIAITDLEGHMEFISPRALSMFKALSTDVFLGRKTIEFLVPEDRDRAIEAIKVMYRGEKRGATRYKAVRMDGSTFDVEVNGEVMKDPLGQPVKMIFVTRDITNKLQLENDLSESHRNLNLLMNNLKGVAYRCANDHQWSMTFLSEGIYELTGYPSSDFIKNSVRDYNSIIFEEDRDYVWREIQKSTGERKSYTLEYRIITNDNSVKWVWEKGQGIFEGEDLTALEGFISDITDRKNAEDKLKKSETNYKSLFFNAPDGYLLIYNGRIIECNRAAETLFGGDKDQIIGKTPADLSPVYQPGGEPSKEISEAEVEELIRSGRNSFEWVHKKLDGKSFVSWVDLSLIEYENKRVIFAVIKDITEAKAIQEALELSERRFSQVAEHTNTTIWEVDPNGLYTYVSPVSVKLYSYHPEELVDKAYFFDLHPDEMRDHFKKTGLEMIKSGRELLNFDNPILRKDGKVIWVTTSGSPIFDSDGKVKGYRGSDIDITERKIAAEELKKFRTISDRANYGNAIASLDGILLYSNDAFARMHGYEAYEIMGKNLSMLHDEEQMVKVGDTIRKLQEKGEFSAEEVWRTRKDGSKFPSLMNGMLIMDDDGKPIYLSATAIDITDIKKHEKEIRDLNQNLEKMVEERTQELLLKTIEADKANRAKSEFLSRMSHELRTPMNSILGFAQLLDMGEMLPAQKRSVHHILRSGNLLLNLINEVLDISRIEAGRLSLSIEPVMVQGVIQEMIDSLQPMFREKEIQVTVIESAHNGLSIKVDKQRLKQIILNLLNNAVKYNKTHGQITIACDGIPDSGNLIKKLRISVEDTGIGIAKEDIEKLFMPFERIGAERTETEGTGLGLAVVKKLVDAMGGWIGVESTKDVGSKFWVEFPLADNTEHHVTPDVVYKSPQDKSGNTRGTIVYIEDNKPNIELVEQIIAEYCPETHLVTHLTGAGAKELVRMVKPNLILLDLNLPEKDGDTVLTEIKTDDEIKDIPVVVISADAMPKKIQQLMKQGALEYLTKPLDVVELVKVIRQYFKGG